MPDVPPVGMPNPNMLPQFAAGGGIVGAAMARQRAAMDNAELPAPVAASTPQYGPMPVNTGAPPKYVANEPSTMNPTQLAAFRAAHGIIPPPTLMGGFLQSLNKLFGG